MKSIFVSSTFRDMHFERDILNRSINPKLNHHLSQYNQSIRILDLRWGVDTTELSEQEASERVLSVCFNEIDNCKPHIIILLGDRYGYVPNNSDMSVTHMEIVRGAIENSQPEQVFIYIRNADYSNMPEDLKQVYIEQNITLKNKLSALKEELQRLMPERCRHYNAYWSDKDQTMVSDDFESLVYADLETDFVESLSAIRYRSELHKQLVENEELLNDNVKFAYKNEDMLHTQVLAIENSVVPYGIIGQAGAGKSVYMSLLCSSLRANGHLASILFCGDNAFSSSVRNAAEYMLYLLTCASKQEYNFEKQSELSYNELLTHIITQREQVQEKSYLLFDAVDKCDGGMVDFILWCHRFLSDQVCIIFSARSRKDITQSEKSLTLADIKYDYQNLRAMTDCLLRKYGKSLNQSLTELICNKVDTPLALNLMLLRLLNLSSNDFDAIQKSGGDIEAINIYLRQIIETSSADISMMIADYVRILLTENRNPNLYIFLLCTLCYSEYGLHETDLQNLCDMAQQAWIQLDYMDFLAQFSFFIRIRDNGRLDISHDIIRQTIRQIFSSHHERFCGLLANYFLAQDNPDTIAIRSFFAAAFLGHKQRELIQFCTKHQHTFVSKKPEDYMQSREIRQCIFQTFLKDNGNFVFSSFMKCNNIEEIMQFQGILSSSLLRSNDYISDDMILQLIQATMAAPLQLTLFPAMIIEMELSACENFVQRHNVNNAEIEEFFNHCRKKISEKKADEAPHTPNTDEHDNKDPFKQMLDSLRDPNADYADSVLTLSKLMKIARKLAGSTESVKQSEEILLGLLELLEQKTIDLDDTILPVTLADIYTSLGVVYKTTKQWEKGIEFDQKSLDIYQKLYQQNPVPDVYRKYRERVYDVANIVEAWAMTEKVNHELWEQTMQRFQEVYRLDMIAIAQGIPERELLQCASSILSYGTSLINIGHCHEGMAKYRESIKLCTELAQNHSRPDLYLELCIYLMECVYQLAYCQKYDAATEISAEIYSCFNTVIESRQENLISQLQSLTGSFSNRLNSFIEELFKQEMIDGGLKLSQILSRVYQAILPVASQPIKANLILTQKNIGDILFLKIQNYNQAFEEYNLLLHLLQQYELAMTDANGKFHDEINLRLIDVYLRALICLEKSDRQDELNNMVEQTPMWAKYLANHSEVLKDDPARVLYVLGVSLSKQNSSLGMLFLMMAFSAVNEKTYDSEKNKETVMMILQALASLKE